MKGDDNMYGPGFPGYYPPGYGYGNGSNGCEWIWIIIVVFVIFFIFSNNRDDHSRRNF